MDKIGLAVVGCGAMSQGTHLPNIIHHPELELLWCCDLEDKALEVCRSRFSPRRMTKNAEEVAADPDCSAILLSTTHSVRLPLIELFARAGKHIYVEKPLADTFEEMSRILAVVRETGVKFTVGHNRRMAPAVQKAQEILRKHRGNPVSPKWRWDRERDERPLIPGEQSTMALFRVNDDNWSWKKWAFTQGALINEMTHFADLACYFIPSRPIRVAAIGHSQANHVVTIEFEDGSLSTIFATAFGSFGYPKELIELYHNGAAIAVDHLMEVRTAGVVGEAFRTTFPVSGDRFPEIKEQGIEGYYLRTLAAQKEVETAGVNSFDTLPPGPDKGHFALLTDFIHCIKHGGEPVCNAADSAISTVVILRALESAARGGIPVDISVEDCCIQPTTTE